VSPPRRRVWLVLAFYAAMALALTSPRLLGTGAYLVDDWFDNEIFFWNFWWLGEALGSGRDPFYTTLLFHPSGTSLGFHPTSYLNASFSLPFQALLGPQRGVILAYNLIILVSLTLSGFFAFLLARRLAGRDAPALAAGLLYGFSAYHFWHLGRLHVGGIEWLPLFLLALLRLLEDNVRPLRDGLLVGGAAVLLLYTSLVNFSSALVMTLCLAGTLLFTRRERILRRPVGLAAAVAAAVILLAALPFLHAWLAYPGPAQAARSVEENVAYSADVAGYLLPGKNSVLYGGLAPREGLRPGGEEIFLGYLPWLLIPFAFLGKDRRQVWLWAGLGLVFFVLSLGPSLRLFGLDSGLPLPYRLLYDVVPLLKVNRTPVRYAAPFLLFLSVVAAFGMRELLRRFPRRPVLVGLLAVAVLESLFSVNLVERQPAPAVYARLASAGLDDVVLNVPLYHARVERRIMYHQLFHGRPLTNACIPRSSTPPHKLIEGTQLRACLLQPSACRRADPRVVRRELEERGIRHVLFHTRFLTPEAARAGGDLLLRAGAVERVEDPAGITAYRF